MDITDWITYFASSHEHESGGRTSLKIEVRIYEQDGELYAEPVYYKLLDKDDHIIMDGAHATKEYDRMWRYIETIVDDEFSGRVLEWYANEHPAFEMIRRERQIEKAMDRDWYISQVL